MTSTEAAVLGSRSEYIGGSDIGALVGRDRFKTALDVWREKVGEAPPFEGNPDTRRGTALEPIAAKHYSARTGIQLRRVNQPLVHGAHHFLRGHIDRRAIGGGQRSAEFASEPIRALNPRGIREIKCPRLGAFAKIKREGIEESRIAQLQFYLGLSREEYGEWIIFCADCWEGLDVPVSADPILYAGMVEIAVHFWNEHVIPRVPPTEQQADEFKLEIAAAGGNVVRRDDAEFADALGLLREAKALSEEAETIEEQAKARLKELIDEKVGVYIAPGARLTYSMSQGKSTFAKDALRAARPLDRNSLALALAALRARYAKDELAIDVLEDVEDAAKRAVLDFAQYEGHGKPYPIMRSTFFGRDE